MQCRTRSFPLSFGGTASVSSTIQPAGFGGWRSTGCSINGEMSVVVNRSSLRRERPLRSDVAVDSAAAVDLRQALLALPRACAAVVLHYLGDLGVADVAVAMDVSPGTVKSTLHDARAALRLVLEGARHA
jgi:RNA polymerase sigma-70 factor (ECF subfamily)